MWELNKKVKEFLKEIGIPIYSDTLYCKLRQEQKGCEGCSSYKSCELANVIENLIQKIKNDEDLCKALKEEFLSLKAYSNRTM